tara:strand:+ start:658 stop:1584 length:927 start_codon:yes stop_codon:yes gene_type:complete
MKIGQIELNKKKKIFILDNNQNYINSDSFKLNTMDLILSLKKNENLSSKIKKLISLKKLIRVNLKEDKLGKNIKILKPIDTEEAWAVGVTYKRQAMEHDKDLSKGKKKVDLYKYVYSNYRAEVFFKGLKRSIRGTNSDIKLRSDSKLVMPEAELVLIIGKNGLPVGYTLGNDLTAWDIEKECPLYLNQAKIWDGSGSFGPWIVPVEKIKNPYNLNINCKVIRKGKLILNSSGNTKDLKRSFEELCYFMNLSNNVSAGSILYTGTACVINHSFFLKKNDKVVIYNSLIGKLENKINLHKKQKKNYKLRK